MFCQQTCLVRNVKFLRKKENNMGQTPIYMLEKKINEGKNTVIDKKPESSQLCKLIYQFSSVSQSSPILCDPADSSKPGFPVCYQLLELPQTHAHQVSDAIQPPRPPSSPSPPTFNLFQR